MSVYFTDRTLHVSVNIAIRGDGGSPTPTTNRTSVYFADTGIYRNMFKSKLEVNFADA